MQKIIRLTKTILQGEMPMSNIFCPSCGAPLQPGTAYCTQCGSRMSATEYQNIHPVTDTGQYQQTAHVSKNKGTVFTVLAIVFFVLAAGIFTAAFLFK
jgi:uncharacterized membrane protein YvbJ